MRQLFGAYKNPPPMPFIRGGFLCAQLPPAPEAAAPCRALLAGNVPRVKRRVYFPQFHLAVNVRLVHLDDALRAAVAGRGNVANRVIDNLLAFLAGLSLIRMLVIGKNRSFQAVAFTPSMSGGSFCICSR